MFSNRKKPRGLVFNTKSYEPTNKTKSKILILTKKGGGKKKIDLSKLEETIDYLSKYSSRSISGLTGELRENYNQLIRYVQLLHGTKYYSVLLDTIKERFKSHGNPKPYTIAAYMTGCMVSTNLDNDSCSPLCSGSIKYTENGEGDFCDHPVVSAKYDYYNNKFDLVNTEGEDSKDRTAFVHVNYTSVHSFPGFDDVEKSWFTQKGYQRVFLYGTSNYQKYINLYPDYGNEPITIKEVKDRVGKVHHAPAKVGTNAITWIGIALIVLFFIIFFAYAYHKNRQNHNHNNIENGRKTSKKQ